MSYTWEGWPPSELPRALAGATARVCIAADRWVAGPSPATRAELRAAVQERKAVEQRMGQRETARRAVEVETWLRDHPVEHQAMLAKTPELVSEWCRSHDPRPLFAREAIEVECWLRDHPTEAAAISTRLGG